MKKEVFDFAAFNKAQIADALTCPMNRHGTRVEHNCDDWGLHAHPQWLMEHYVAKGGAIEFAKRRKDFIRLVEELELEFHI